MKFVVDTRLGGIESALVSKAKIDKAISKMESEGYKLITTPENVQLRVSQGNTAPISTTSNFVREGFLYIPKKGGFFVRNSPILDDLVGNAKANKKMESFIPQKSK